jgi:DNA-directed RNA polymerase subunit RPC12/RpoP
MNMQNNSTSRANTADIQRYICPHCGGSVCFDITKQQLACSSCGAPADFQLNSTPVTEHPYMAGAVDASQERAAAPSAGSEITCQVCGAQISLTGAQTAAVCPMCGAAHVLPAKQNAGLPPDGVVPFKVDRYKAMELLRKWIGGRWFAPNKLKKSYQEGGISPVYLPFWSFDADASAHYTGRGGRTRVVRRGKQTTTVTDWFPVSGIVRSNFTDLQICAAGQPESDMAMGVTPFRGSSRPYDAAYLAGTEAQHYTVSLDRGYNIAQGKMESELHMLAEADIRSKGFQLANVHSISADYRNVKYKQLLCPVWLSNFTYAGKSYQCAINGETGNVSGKRPYSPVKIAFAVIIIILCGLIFLYLFGDDSPQGGPPPYFGEAKQQTTYQLAYLEELQSDIQDDMQALSADSTLYITQNNLTGGVSIGILRTGEIHNRVAGSSPGRTLL